jgi:hypothetical protein
MNLFIDTRVRSLLAGGFGGLLGWILAEALLGSLMGKPLKTPVEMYGIDATLGAISGLSLGTALGLAGGLTSYGLRSRAWTTALISAMAGLLGGTIGLVIGEAIFQPLATIPFLGRSIGWGVFGAILGTAEGISRKSSKGLRNGMIGGAIGGAIGGVAFDLVGMVLISRNSNEMSRAVTLTVTGACIGVFIALIEGSLADGVLKIASGRQGGSEFYLDKPVLTIGRSEQCDVSLFSDPAILRRHATIRQEEGRHVLHGEPGAIVMLNRQRISRQALSSGDEMMIGNVRLIYRARKRKKGKPVGPKAAYQPQTPTRYCRSCHAPNRGDARTCVRCGRLVG